MDCHKHCAASLKWARGLLICVIGFVGLGSVVAIRLLEEKRYQYNIIIKNLPKILLSPSFPQLTHEVGRAVHDTVNLGNITCSCWCFALKSLRGDQNKVHLLQYLKVEIHEGL